MKKQDDLPQVVVIREGMLQLAVCSSIPPEKASAELTDAVHRLLPPAGTSNGWIYDDSMKPVECESYEGRWHYTMLC
jgi:hypothetical protein